MPSKTLATKRCTRCGQTKPVTAFHRDRGKVDGRVTQCKACRSALRKRKRPSRASATSAPRPSRRRYKAGDRFGALELVEYVESSASGSRARFRCDCGAEKVVALRNVTHRGVDTCADRTKHPDPRLTESPTYGTMHKRLVKLRGSASELPCARCGKVDKGNQWAYRHSTFDEVCQVTGKDRGRVYALEPEHYWVLCRSHHASWDRAKAKQPGLSLFHVALAMAYEPDYSAPTRLT